MSYNLYAIITKRGDNMRICPNCQTENQDDFKFCVSCGTRCDGKEECPKCKKEIDATLKFCPYCGAKRRHAHDSRTKEKTKNTILQISNLASKITVATLSVIMLLVFLFAPIYGSKLDTTTYNTMGATKEIYVYQSGVKVISNGFRAISKFDEDAATDLLEKRMEKFEDKYGNIDEANNKIIQEALNIVSPYDFLLVDGADSNNSSALTSHNKVIQAQVVISAMTVIEIVILLILASVFSIIAIFKKNYSYKKLVIIYSVILGLVALVVTVLRLPGAGAIAAANAGPAAITVLIMLVVTLVLIYLYSIFNKKTSFNFVNLLSKSIGMVVVFVALILASGHLMNADVSNSSIDSYTLKPTIQSQMETIDIISEYSFDEEWNYQLDSLLSGYKGTRRTFKNNEISYSYNLNYVYSSDKVISDTFAPELIFILGIVYYFTGISLGIVLILVTVNLYRDKKKKGDIIAMIPALALAVVTLILTIVIVIQLNSISDLRSYVPSITTTVSPMIVSAIVLMIGFTIYTPILNKKAKKKEAIN